MCGPGRLALHRNPENPVNPRLVASALALDPCQHIGIEADRQLLLCRRPCGRCFSEELISERQNVGIVNRLGVQPSGLCRGELPGLVGVKRIAFQHISSTHVRSLSARKSAKRGWRTQTVRHVWRYSVWPSAHPIRIPLFTVTLFVVTQKLLRLDGIGVSALPAHRSAFPPCASRATIFLCAGSHSYSRSRWDAPRWPRRKKRVRWPGGWTMRPACFPKSWAPRTNRSRRTCWISPIASCWCLV